MIKMKTKQIEKTADEENTFWKARFGASNQILHSLLARIPAAARSVLNI